MLFFDDPLLAGLGADFNLPRLIGNAANFRFDPEGDLRLVPGSRPMWDDADGDVFTRLRSDMEWFVKRSRTRGFLQTQADTLRQVRATYAANVDVGDMQA